jgi:hypothetical protein
MRKQDLVFLMIFKLCIILQLDTITKIAGNDNEALQKIKKRNIFF